ncbi:MAG: YbjN domain-containing protein [Chloroflexi bacterium]|nr:YbjN domain-containing protein [Chloroflexota bacterium]
MSRSPSTTTPTPVLVDGWLAELGLEPHERVERAGITSWDLRLDGLRRFDIQLTLILDPALGLIVWVHFAPPIMDSYRRSYRKLLHWNDDYPFVKFSLAADERPILTTELPPAMVTRDELGFAIARLLTICDQLLEESAGWLWIGGRMPDHGDRIGRNAALFARYADRLAELAEPAQE